MRVTRTAVEIVFHNWLVAVGGKQSTSYDDVGSYHLDYNPVYGGYEIQRICNVHGGVSVVMYQRLSAAAMVAAMNFAIATLEQKRLAPVTVGDMDRVIKAVKK